MKFIIMCAGKGKRWKNYLGIPKHFVKINGETLIGRTTRILKEHNIDYVITSSDKRYKKYGITIPQSSNDCEVDRFENTKDKEICYLYGDVYYTDEALDTIINTLTNEILFFGSDEEIFAIKIINKPLFMKHKNRVKRLYLKNKIERCIGWEIYRSLNNIPFNEHIINERYYLIDDGTDDIDYPEDYEHFVSKYEGGVEMIKVEVIEPFTLGRFDELENIERASVETPGKLNMGDKFECTKDIADYLLGDNPIKRPVVKVIEIIPAEIPTPNAVEVKIPQEVIKSLGEKVKKIKTTKKKSTK